MKTLTPTRFQYNLSLLNGGSTTVRVEQKVNGVYQYLATQQTQTTSGTYELSFVPQWEDIRISVSGTSRYALNNLYLDRDQIDTLISTYALSRGYRYGSDSYRNQGQEKDDEAKGRGNSYDFGARMYDSRLGRWLTIDPLSRKQPDQSTYKAMLNNPIFWTDPDGKTEYETIIIKDERVGITFKVYRAVSVKVMTDGVVCDNLRREFNHVDYYDYSHVTKYTIKADGNMTVENRTDIVFRNGVKYKENVTLEQYFGQIPKKGHVINPKNRKFYQAGGFYMTGKDGQGTKYHSSNPDFVGNIDMFLGLMSKYKASGKINIPKEIKDPDGGWDMIETLMKTLEVQAETVDNVLHILEEWKIGSSSSNEMSKKSRPYSNTRVWRTESDGVYRGTTDFATPKEIQNGDTLGGKHGHKESHPERKD